jgi:hypothetical protein
LLGPLGRAQGSRAALFGVCFGHGCELGLFHLGEEKGAGAREGAGVGGGGVKRLNEARERQIKPKPSRPLKGAK